MGRVTDSSSRDIVGIGLTIRSGDLDRPQPMARPGDQARAEGSGSRGYCADDSKTNRIAGRLS
jgi:hypothetical protein